MDLAIKTLRYNALLEQVQVGFVGELDDLMVQMREVALLEAQQILRAVATAPPASLLEDEAPQATSTRSLGAARR